MRVTEVNDDGFTCLLFDIDGQMYTVLQHLLNEKMTSKQINNKINHLKEAEWFREMCEDYKQEYNHDCCIILEGEKLKTLKEQFVLKNRGQFISKHTRNLTLIHENILPIVMSVIDKKYALKSSIFLTNIRKHIGDYSFTEIKNVKQPEEQIEKLTAVMSTPSGYIENGRWHYYFPSRWEEGRDEGMW